MLCLSNTLVKHSIMMFTAFRHAYLLLVPIWTYNHSIHTSIQWNHEYPVNSLLYLAIHRLHLESDPLLFHNNIRNCLCIHLLSNHNYTTRFIHFALLLPVLSHLGFRNRICLDRLFLINSMLTRRYYSFCLLSSF